MNPAVAPDDEEEERLVSALGEFEEMQHCAVEHLKVSYQKLLERYEKERQLRVRYEKIIQQMHALVETTTTAQPQPSSLVITTTLPEAKKSKTSDTEQQQPDTSSSKYFTPEEREIIWQFGQEHQGAPRIPWAQLLPKFPGRKSRKLGKCFQHMKATRLPQNGQHNTILQMMMMDNLEEDPELSSSEGEDE